MSYFYCVFAAFLTLISWSPFTYSSSLWDNPLQNANLILKGGTVVNVRKKEIEKRDLYICQGMIVEESVGKKCASKILDVSGKWLIPGLSDMHVHARGQLFGNDAWRDLSPRKVAENFAKAGVVHLLDAMQDEKVIFPARDAQQRENNAHEADIFCAGGAFTPSGGHGFEYLDIGVPMSALHVADTPKQAVAEVNAMALKRPDVIKIMYDHRGRDAHGNTTTTKDGEMGVLGRAMQKVVMRSIVKRSLELGLKPYVHIGVWSDAEDAINAGATIITHLGGDTISDDLLALIRKKKIYWIPTLVTHEDFTNIKKNQDLLKDELLKKISLPGVINSLQAIEFFSQWSIRYC